MSLIIKITPDGLYEASATPPHVSSEWSTITPLLARQVIEELKKRGCPQQDVADALYEQDADWVAKVR